MMKRLTDDQVRLTVRLPRVLLTELEKLATQRDSPRASQGVSWRGPLTSRLVRNAVLHYLLCAERQRTLHTTSDAFQRWLDDPDRPAQT
jgi:hypothetical protein